MIQAVPRDDRSSLTDAGDPPASFPFDDSHRVAAITLPASGRCPPTPPRDLRSLFGNDADLVLAEATRIADADSAGLLELPGGTLCLLVPSKSPDSADRIVMAEAVATDTPTLVRRLGELTAFARRQQHALAAAHETIRSQRDQLNAYAVQVSEDLEELTWLRALANNLELSESDNTPERIVESVLPSLRHLLRAVTLVFIRDTPLGNDNQRLPFVWQTGGVEFDPEIPLQIAAAATHVTTERPLVRNHCGERHNDRALPGVDSFIVVPVATSSSRIGWLIAVNKDTGHSPEWVDGFGHISATHMSEHEFGTFEASLMGATAVVLAAHGRNCSLLREKEVLLKGVIRSLVNAIDAKDSYTCGHSDRVAEIARMIAREMGLPPAFCEEIHMTGLLHDIGKIGVPDHVLKKAGKLTDAEFELVKQHPAIGYEILKHLQNLDYVLPGVLHHHEQVDGSGYPHGLAGDEIPLAARILAVADSYDAMTSSRPYRPGMPTEKAEAILSAGDGSQWDSVCLQAFQSILPRVRSIAEQHSVFSPAEPLPQASQLAAATS